MSFTSSSYTRPSAGMVLVVESIEPLRITQRTSNSVKLSIGHSTRSIRTASNGCDTARVRFVECSKLAAEVESVSIRRAAPASSESRVNPFMDVLLSHTPPSLTPTLVEQLSDEVDNRLPLPYLNQQLDLPSSSVAVLSEPSGVRGFFGCLMSTLWSNSPGTSSSGLKRQRYYKGQDEYDGRIGDEGTKLTKRRRTLY